MRFGVLGPLDVQGGAGPVVLSAPKARLLLAVLLAYAGDALPADQLVDTLWGSRPPRSAADNLRVYIHQLRRALGDPGRIVRQPGGYAIVVHPGELDSRTFDELAGRAANLAAAGDPAAARAARCEALALWRGAAFADVEPVPVLVAEATRLAERRMSVLEARVDADLAAGRHADLVAELSYLTAEHPLRERFRGQLMLALYRSGRQAEALKVYRDTRQLLDAELGVEPTAQLRWLERAVLNADPALDLPPGGALDPSPGGSGAALPPASPAAGAAVDPGRPVPAQLPADSPTFTGRAQDLADLDKLLARPRVATTIAAITGMPGVGKTALAVHWAHRVRDRFPDGQLYLNLRGYAADAELRPLDALSRFLHALGVPAGKVPLELDEAAALYRSLLADRRVLVVLDNARGADQVRPLLPGSPGSAVVITSRDRLSSLVAGESAHRVRLDDLSPEESRALLAGVLGADRIAREPAAAEALVALCGRLPLSLRIAAANVADSPDQRLDGYVASLSKGDRIAALNVDSDERDGVRAAFDLSYAGLDPVGQRLFRLLALSPGPDVTVPAAAALADLPSAHANRLLRGLASAHLLEQSGDRYTFHDLLRLYAAELATGTDSEGERQAAVGRLFDWYLRRTAAASNVVAPQMVRLPAVAAAATEPRVAESFETEADALAWLDAELANLSSAATQAAARGLHRYAWLLADALRGYQWQRRNVVDWLATAEAGLAAARAVDDPMAQAACLSSEADALSCTGRHLEAVGCYEAAIALARSGRWLDGEAALLANEAGTYWELGQLADAADRLDEAITINRRTGWGYGLSANLHNLGTLHRELGRSEQAIAHLLQARPLMREYRTLSGEAHTLTNLGEAHLDLGQLDTAATILADALAAHREVGDRYGEAATLSILANLRRETGAYEVAIRYATEALALSERTSDLRNEMDARNALAAVRLRVGDVAGAAAGHERAARLARQSGNRFPLTIALTGLATAARCQGASDDARRFATEAADTARTSGYSLLEGQALTELAATQLASGAPGAAVEAAGRAADIHLAMGHALSAARALRALGKAWQAIGRSDEAATAWDRAAGLIGDLAVPDAAELRTLLGTAGPTAGRASGQAGRSGDQQAGRRSSR
jgi:DNA-binding SARP family transcriptional activator/tetratricopeptide (TPR) repeat protein